MKVLLTGANGFVGSHVLDRLLDQGVSTVALLRAGSDRALIAARLQQVELRTGSLGDPASLDAALDGVTHVIHCAGATKALSRQGFLEVNQVGTRQVVSAVNRRHGQIERLVLISSLAAAGPGTREHPRREQDRPAPVSDYGHSKLAAEREVIEGCKPDWTIVRPPAVYGPRDREFLRLFKAVRSHVMPRFGGGRQPLTLAYVTDLAAAIVAVMSHENARREVFFAGTPTAVTAAGLAHCIAAAMKTWTVPLPLPNAVLWLACQWAECVTRVTRRASVLSAQKWPELAAEGWVCEVSKLKDEVGYDHWTTLPAGVEMTCNWYRDQGWL